MTIVFAFNPNPLAIMAGILGNVHPALVHLPIGILFLACIYKLMAIRRHSAVLNGLLKTTLFIGFISIVLSIVTGYILSLDGGYDTDLLTKHQYSAYILALLTLAWIYFESQADFRRLKVLLMAFSLLALFITGHLGGSITHGEGFLTGDSDKPVVFKKPVIKDVQQAAVYTDIVQPILAEKCYSCHNKSRQKGALRLDEPLFIMKGGKEGLALEPGKADESDMIKRMLLPVSDDDHMPPKKKPQPSEAEIALLHWWIQEGAPFDKKVAQLNQPVRVKNYLRDLEKAPTEQEEELPAVAKGDAGAIEALKKKGILVLPLATDNNYLHVSFISARQISSDDLRELVKLKDQVIDLNAGGKQVGDSAMDFISRLTNLRKLRLDDSRVTDAGIQKLSGLKFLRYLNVKGTAVSAAGLSALAPVKTLKTVYTFNSGIKTSDFLSLKKTLPQARIDTGNYSLPLLESDTSILTRAPVQ